MPVMSSWKYASAYASPKGTLIYSYFPNGVVNAVLGIEDLSKGIWLYPVHRFNIENILHNLTGRKYPLPFIECVVVND